MSSEQSAVSSQQSAVSSQQLSIINYQFPNKMKLPEEPDIPAQINIVPMIDVIFAILAFFIMSSLFLTKLEGLPVNLPKASSAQQQQATEPIAVTIDDNGTLSLNRKPITLDNLEAEIKKSVNLNQERLVIVNADEKVGHGKVVAVMDRLRKIPRVRLAIGTEKP